MAPSEYFIRLQKGIEGGFAPPTPSAILKLVKSADDSNIIINESIRPDGEPGMERKPQKTLDSSDEEVQDLVTELYEILQTLPLESPPGSEDIYRRDTSITWGSDDFEWCNGGPQGCTREESDVHPSEAEQSKFVRAIDIVRELVGMGTP
ncbi:hypothetical protein BDV38DRAFT_249145 [Aspergillus pseudotamarii]|uniref:Uncharacterized protein n=1 Tax=Aspergillus pseudotamarii TaxID=132259 RepID=A0A5N6SUH6_ASPPS|nr:uncharacterized protein BDV38DRAFT_249145 [Aspergillus pseudotamarii]KAE8136794.1 hypothetical protein BDV38DRAFT_249145 [Aspergillus pseudotamarii]